jgi:deoxyadenosine/deoxycytidine kinase
MSGNSLLFQMKVLQHHMKQYPYTQTHMARPSKITERSPLSCLHVFGANLQQNQLLNDLEMKLMQDMNSDFGWMPELVFYIDTPPQTCYERIHIRSRENEIIPMNYLCQIDELYTKLYKTEHSSLRPREVYLIDGSKKPEEVLKQIVDIMKIRFAKMTSSSI